MQVGFVLLYLVLYIVHMVGTFRQLAGRPYQHARVSNILFRIQVCALCWPFICVAHALRWPAACLCAERR